MPNNFLLIITYILRVFQDDIAFIFLPHRKIEPLLVTIPVGVNPNLECNSHYGHEFDYVLEGVMRLKVGDQIMVMNPGDSAYYDSIHPHAMQAVGDQPCVFLAMVIP